MGGQGGALQTVGGRSQQLESRFLHLGLAVDAHQHPRAVLGATCRLTLDGDFRRSAFITHFRLDFFARWQSTQVAKTQLSLQLPILVAQIQPRDRGRGDIQPGHHIAVQGDIVSHIQQVFVIKILLMLPRNEHLGFFPECQQQVRIDCLCQLEHIGIGQHPASSGRDHFQVFGEQPGLSRARRRLRNLFHWLGQSHASPDAHPGLISIQVDREFGRPLQYFQLPDQRHPGAAQEKRAVGRPDQRQIFFHREVGRERINPLTFQNNISQAHAFG